MRNSFEIAYLKSIAGAVVKPRIPVTPYIPNHRMAPARRLEVLSAWDGIQDILSDIIERFQLNTDRCLEFGVEYGFSTVALSSILIQ